MGRFRMNEHVLVEMPKQHIKSETNVTATFDAAAKRFTMLVKTSLEMPNSDPIRNTTCTFIEFPNLVAPAALAKCINSMAALFKATKSSDGLEEFDVKIPQIANVSVSESIYIDDAFVLKRLVS